MREDELEKRVRKRVKNIREFYTHIVVYLMVNALLVVIWHFTGGGFPWFVFVLGGWGIGIVLHWYTVFIEEGLLGKNWEDKKVEKLMEKERAKRRK